MNWIIMGLGAALLLALLRLWRCERQLKDWAEQLEETDENSNLRLGTSVRSRAFLRCCRAMNHRLENGQQARIRLENMSRELKYTVSCVSHDIRTPLTGAMGYLQLLENTPDAARQKEYISIIRRRMEDLEGLLEELFLFSKLSNEEYSIECSKQRHSPCSAMCWQASITGLRPRVWSRQWNLGKRKEASGDRRKRCAGFFPTCCRMRCVTEAGGWKLKDRETGSRLPIP